MFVTSEELIKKVNADSPVDTEDFLNAYYPYFKNSPKSIMAALIKMLMTTLYSDST